MQFRLYKILCLITISFHLGIAQLPLDMEGWTIVEPSADSRIIYVSSSQGDDSNDGLSAESPVASLNQAKSLARPGFPDHILLKTGDEWMTEYGFGNFHSGKSATEPILISYYGEGNKRPIINCENAFIRVFDLDRSHIAIVGIEFYAYKHDPTTSLYSKDSKQTALSWEFAEAENILVEDCVFRYMQLGSFSGNNSSEGPIKNLKLRRNIAVQSWGANSYNVHLGANRAQGLYLSKVDGVLIEDNLFDHNGWNADVPGAGPNKFNHNIYMQYDCPNPDKIIVSNNILARGAAHGLQLRAGGTVDNNLFIQNSVNLNIGYNNGAPVSSLATGDVKHNVFTEVRMMDSIEATQNDLRSLAVWGINELNLPSVITDNIFVHALNRAGVAIGEYDDIYNLGGELITQDNLEFRWTNLQQQPNEDWFDPLRKIKDYHRTLGEEGSTEAFLLAARERPLRTIWDQYSANTVNEFMFRGFKTDVVDTIQPLAPDTIYIERISGNFAIIKWSWGQDNERTVSYRATLGDSELSERIYTDSIILRNLEPMTSYTFAITSLDIAENESDDQAAITFTTIEADNIPPTIPYNLSILNITHNEIEIDWEESTDNLLLEGYQLYLDGEPYFDNLLTNTEYTFEDLDQARTYIIGVSAIDVAGNVSGIPEVTGKTTDITPPSIPDVLTATITPDGEINATWTLAIDNDSVDFYNVYINANEADEPVFITTDTFATFMVSEMEEYKIRITSVDVSGNESNLSRPVTAELVSSVHEEQLTGLEIIPNPVNGYFTIKNKFYPVSYSLYSVSGKVLITNATCKQVECTVPVNQFLDGIYFLKVEGPDGKVKTTKIYKSEN